MISRIWDWLQERWEVDVVERLWPDREVLSLAEDAGAPGTVYWCANSGLQTGTVPCHCLAPHVVYRPVAVYDSPPLAGPDPFISPYPI